MINLPQDSTWVSHRRRAFWLSDNHSAQITWMISLWWTHSRQSVDAWVWALCLSPAPPLLMTERWEPNMTLTLISPHYTQSPRQPAMAGRAQAVLTRSPCSGLRRAGHDEPDDECGATESIILKGEHVNSSFSMQLAWQQLDIIPSLHPPSPRSQRASRKIKKRSK